MAQAIENTSNGAVMRGYTQEALIIAGCAEFCALIKPDTDLDDRFKAFDTDSMEWLYINGWSCDIELIKGE